MRTDWVSPSAATLVVGAFALVLGTMLSPADGGENANQALRVVNQNEGRMLGMAVFYFLASLGLMLGLPAVLSVVARRGWRLGVTGVMVFSVGVLGTAGFAMLLVFFRALVVSGSVTAGSVDQLTDDLGLVVFVYTWVVGFYAGLILIAAALFVSRATPYWVPGLLLVAVAVMPFADMMGTIGPALQTLCLAVGFTGVAVAAVAADQQRQAGSLLA
jgi:hypothetical protein